MEGSRGVPTSGYPPFVLPRMDTKQNAGRWPTKGTNGGAQTQTGAQGTGVRWHKGGRVERFACSLATSYNQPLLQVIITMGKNHHGKRQGRKKVAQMWLLGIPGFLLPPLASRPPACLGLGSLGWCQRVCPREASPGV